LLENRVIKPVSREIRWNGGIDSNQARPIRYQDASDQGRQYEYNCYADFQRLMPLYAGFGPAGLMELRPDGYRLYYRLKQVPEP
jgi:hypothetical protein